jgi:hypothetical protein
MMRLRHDHSLYSAKFQQSIAPTSVPARQLHGSLQLRISNTAFVYVIYSIKLFWKASYRVKTQGFFSLEPDEEGCIGEKLVRRREGWKERQISLGQARSQTSKWQETIFGQLMSSCLFSQNDKICSSFMLSTYFITYYYISKIYEHKDFGLSSTNQGTKNICTACIVNCHDGNKEISFLS